MKKSKARRNDCDLAVLSRDNIAYTGIAHIGKVAIQTKVLPKPLVFPKASIIHILFKQRPYQAEDELQLSGGGKTSGEIVGLDEVDFTIAENGQRVALPRKALLALMFLCNVTAARAKKR